MKEKPEGAFYQEKRYETREDQFRTPTGKIEIYSEAIENVGFDPLPTYKEPTRSPLGSPELLEKYPLILSTGNRNLYYIHGQLRQIKSLHEKSPEPQTEIGPKTAEQYGIRQGDRIIVQTDRGAIKMKARVDERVAEGVVLVPHGWPDEANVNLLTDTQVREPIVGYPQTKSLLCAIRKAQFS